MTDNLELAKEQAEEAFAMFYQAESPAEAATLAAMASAHALVDIAAQLRELNARVGYIAETKHVHWVNPEP